MKDYYQVLGVSEDAGEDDIRKAFRRLAFQYHPDKNPGHEKEAERKFKDINEAYGVLSDKMKRRQYDLSRKGQFVGAGYGARDRGFSYSQEDIFRDTFANQAMMDELNRMFAQAGLRFDEDFLNRVFFNANNVVFRVYYYGSTPRRPVERRERPSVERRQIDYSNYVDSGDSRRADREEAAPGAYRPNFIERWLGRALMKVSGFVFRKLLGIQYESPQADIDYYQDLEISSAEAAAGGERVMIFQRDRETKKLMVKIPAGIRSGTRIRLRGLGRKVGRKTGDLYLRVKVDGE